MVKLERNLLGYNHPLDGEFLSEQLLHEALPKQPKCTYQNFDFTSSFFSSSSFTSMAIAEALASPTSATVLSVGRGDLRARDFPGRALIVLA